MTRSLGLSDTQRTYFEIAISMIGAAQMFIISNAIISDVPVDPTAIWVLALIVAVIAPAKTYLGIRDASTAAFAKKANEVDDSIELRQFRKIDDDQVIKKVPPAPPAADTPKLPPS
jgi:hypothetical protein